MNDHASSEAATGCNRADYETVREEELRCLQLSDAERDLFLKAMESPHEPTTALKRAVIRHLELNRDEETQS